MNRIQELRRKAGLTQTQLADNIDLSQNTLSQYESGRRPVSSRVVLLLSQFFNVSPAYLLGESDEIRTEQAVETSPIELSNVRKVCVEYGADNVNLLLRMGWKLLHVDQYSDGDYSAPAFTLGWFSASPAPDYDRTPPGHVVEEDEVNYW